MLAKKVRFDSMSNLLARDYCDEKTMKMVDDINPFNADEENIVKSKHKPTMNMMRNFGLL